MVHMVGLNNFDEYRMVLEDSLGQARSTGSRANNCCLCTHESPRTSVDAKQIPSLPHSAKTPFFFNSGIFSV